MTEQGAVRGVHNRLECDANPLLDVNRSTDDLEAALRSLAQSPLNWGVRRRIREIIGVLDAREVQDHARRLEDR